MTGQLPASLLFGEVLLIWHVTNYLLRADPFAGNRASSSPRRTCLTWFSIRSLGAAGMTLAIAGWWPGSLLAGVVLGGCFLLPVARWLWVAPRYLGELELGANCGFAALAWFLIMHFGMTVRWQFLRFPGTEQLVAAYLAGAALLIFAVRGGTFIVRGVLNRAGTMPPPEAPSSDVLPPDALDLRRALPVDTIELNHGRLIGNVERLILVLFVANGQYTALAFFFAAKGLIRSKDIERRAWADYLILGSLTSFLVAVVIGLLIQTVFRAWIP